MPNNRMSAAYIRQREEEARDRAACVTYCAFCGWSYTGTALEGREKAAQHRSRLHPQARRRRRPNRGLGTWRYPVMDAEHEAEVYAERDRRARLLGIDIA